MPQNDGFQSKWLDDEFPKSDSSASVFADFTRATPLPEGAEQAFKKSKLHLLRTAPIPPHQRNALVQRFLKDSFISVTSVESGPTPGGVGYGMFYTPAFKGAFQAGTGLAWGIVCPIPPGGNVSDWLYLTGMNRAGLGCEAFVAYHGQNDITFNVFDWSRSPQWQVHRPLSSMPEYLGTITANGAQFPVILVMNLTYQTNPTTWVNEVRVLNNTTQALDLAYQYSYQASLAQQLSPGVGSWAAIVETFQASYSGTKPMGCVNAKVATRAPDGAWAAWVLLDPTQVTLRVDNKGFHQLFLDPDFSWAVES